MNTGSACSSTKSMLTSHKASMCGRAGVKRTALMVLSHLILNDMMKVKGHIARIALCLQDPEPSIASMAQLFFHELARRASKVCIHMAKCLGPPDEEPCIALLCASGMAPCVEYGSTCVEY